MFVAPEFEVVKFNVVDVITTSTNEEPPKDENCDVDGGWA
jgi:hypothetical protein